MEEKEEEIAGNYCASCGSPIPPGVVTCPKCSKAKIAGKRPMQTASEEATEDLIVVRTPEASIRRSVAYGTLTREQGELLLLLLSEGRLLDFAVRSVLSSLLKDIAEERNSQRMEDRVHVLIELVSVTMPSGDFERRLFHTFRLG